MKNQYMIVVACWMLTACASRTVKLLDANWTSMKHSMPPSAKEKLVKVGNVNEEYCLKAWSGSFGLMDEAVKLAESKNQIDYIRYPSFTHTQGTSCVQVSGEGYRVTN